MGDGTAAVIGGIIGGALTAGPAYKAGYSKRDAELQLYINQLQRMNIAKDQKIAQLADQMREKDAKIAELEKERNIPVLSDIKMKLGGAGS